MPNLNRTDALKKLLDLSYRLSTEKNTTHLLEDILLAAKDLCHADAGTIYSMTDEGCSLKFETLFNDSLSLYLGGTSDDSIPYDNIPMYIDDNANHGALVTLCAHSKELIHIPDAYQCEKYPLTQAKKMDQITGYHTQSVLTVPMLNQDGDINGVLQLINPKHDENIVDFSPEKIELVTAMASLAAVAITNQALIENMEELFQAFARLIARAIDEKSPYTGGHCRRVPQLTMFLARIVNKVDYGPFSDFLLNEEELHALSVAGWLHDCGKVATPEYVMDKASKLQTIFDRIELINARFTIIEKELEILYLKNEIDSQQFSAANEKLLSDKEFINQTNIGGEFMTESHLNRLEEIAQQYTYTSCGTAYPLFTHDEYQCLQIQRGTLTEEERNIINRHMDITIMILESLPFPKHLKNVPEYAGGHHEKMDGTGYPKGLTKEQMSVPARMMAIADIFEALTASDRPYKDAKKISECLSIMCKMVKGNHIDGDLFEVFVKEEVYMIYATKFLKPEQIDQIDKQALLEQLV